MRVLIEFKGFCGAPNAKDLGQNAKYFDRVTLECKTF